MRMPMPLLMPLDGFFADLPSQSMSRPLFLVMTDNDDDDGMVVVMVCNDEWDSLWRFRSIVAVPSLPSSSSSSSSLSLLLSLLLSCLTQ